MKRIISVLISCIILTFTAYADVAQENTDSAKSAMLEAMLDFERSVDISAYGLSADTLYNAFSEVVNNTPQLFYINVSYSYTVDNNTGKVLYVRPNYRYNREEATEKLRLINEECAKILIDVTPEMTEAEKALCVHDYIALHYEYNTPAVEAGVLAYPQAYNMEGLFLEKKAVCQGFTLGYMYALKLLGIECAFVPCTPMGHAWDLVKIDGSWYHVDVTADLDYKKIPGSVYHKFFMLSDAALAETDHYGWTVVHEADNTSYDNSFWRDVSSGIFYRDGYWYYSDNDYSGRNPECVICRRDASNGVTDILVRNIGTWSYSQDGFNFYQRLGMAKLFLYGDRIYYSAPKGIYSAKLDGTDVTKVYTPVTDGSYTYVFGLANSGEKAVYSVFKFPYEAVDYIGEFDLPHLADSNKLHFLSFDGTPAVALTDDEITEGKIFAAAYNEDKTECLQVISEEITDKRLYYFEFSADGYSSVKYMLFDGLMPIAKPVETVK